MWCRCWRAAGFAWCVRSQVIGITTRRGARDETGARPARARPAQAMRLTANRHFSVIKSCNLRQFNSINYKDLRKLRKSMYLLVLTITLPD